MTNLQQILEDETFIQFLRASEHREKAIAKLFDREKILERICQDIKTKLGFEFVAIQLIRPEEHIIEAVHGTEWAGRARHYLERNEKLRDIQADIAQTCKTEIIAGWDEDERFKDKNYEVSRFDKWVYQEFGHKDYVRVFTPILLIWDESGNLNQTWFDNSDYEVTKNKVDRDWFNHPEQRLLKQNGQHTVIELRLPSDLDTESNQTSVQAIGTLEVGYINAREPIEVNSAIALIKLVAQQALEIYPYMLPGVLKDIADSAMDSVKADSATLHFTITPNQNRYVHKISAGRIIQHFLKVEEHPILYVYEVSSGKISQNFLKIRLPRKRGLGQRAIHKERYQSIPQVYCHDHNNQKLEDFSPEAFYIGQIKAMVALPLLIEHKQGVLYLLFKEKHQFIENELRWANIFAQGAVDAIRHAINYEEMWDRTNQLLTLHALTQSLAQIPDKSNLLHHIAWDTLNILAADIVTIYEYIEAERKFPHAPAIAGKLKGKKEVYEKLERNDVPYKLIEHGKNVYAPRVDKKLTFQDSLFTTRENIQSAAGVLLKIVKDNQEEIVGVMLISYRRRHRFSSLEKQIVETLASSAAIAIKNQRWLTTLQEIDREIITNLDLDQLLFKILQKAVSLANANVGDILLLDPIRNELVMKTRHWPNEEFQPKLERIKLDEGITGWVAKNREAQLVPRVEDDPRYKACYDNIGSELCVPLLDQDKGVLGVINVESDQTEAFNQTNLRMLETLAAQTVIAIQNVENKEKLVANEQIATLGHVATLLMQKVRSYTGAIQVWAQRILTNKDDSYRRDAATEIQHLADVFFGQVRYLQSWLRKDSEPIDLQKILYNALSQVTLPSNVKVIFNISENLPQVLAGKQPLIHVFYNLIQNAHEAMPEGGELSIDCRRVDRDKRSWAVVKVSDTGVGISPETQTKIFRPGYTMKPNHEGVGLWWTQVYLKGLNGELEVKSSVGKGTTFTVVLPASSKLNQKADAPISEAEE